MLIILLAIELLLFEFSPRSINPVALACNTGAAGHHLLFGADPVFTLKGAIARFYCNWLAVVPPTLFFFRMENTIRTEKISRSGVKTPDSYGPNVPEKITVEEVMVNNGLVLSEDNSIEETIDWLEKEPEYKPNYFIVSDKEGVFKGIIIFLQPL